MRPAILLAGALSLVACERAKAPATRSSTSSTATAASTSASLRGGVAAGGNAKKWADELGPILAMASADAGKPIVFQKDTADAMEVEVELLGRGGRTSRAMLRTGAVTHSCASRRDASLTAIDGKAIPDGWSLALSRGVADPFSIGGIEELAQRDSAALVARISRLVSGIPEDSASAPFRGLPVVVRDAWSFRLADSTAVVVAIAMRSDNVESNPRAEAMVLVVEPDRSVGDGRWRTGFSERVAGPEDRVEGMDLLAAFQVHGARPAVALVREGDAGVELEIVERQEPGVWAVRWSGLSMLCAGP